MKCVCCFSVFLSFRSGEGSVIISPPSRDVVITGNAERVVSSTTPVAKAPKFCEFRKTQSANGRTRGKNAQVIERLPGRTDDRQPSLHAISTLTRCGAQVARAPLRSPPPPPMIRTRRTQRPFFFHPDISRIFESGLRRPPTFLKIRTGPHA